MADAHQSIPVRIYQTDAHVMRVTPMPGLEAEDISITISGDHVRIQSEKRGSRHDELGLLVNEWTIGACYREISLDRSIVGHLANATFGNGVLILAMPKREGKPEPTSKSLKGFRRAFPGRAAISSLALISEWGLRILRVGTALPLA